jgi:hypothetical protein
MLANNTLLRDATPPEVSHGIATAWDAHQQPNVIHIQKFRNNNTENTEITKFLRNSLRTENFPGATMSDPSREEVDAKLATVEARTETRFVELGGKIDRVGDSITAFNSAMTNELSGVKSELTTVKADNKYTRWTIVLAILAAIAALWVTQGNLLSAFQTGLLVKSEPHPSSIP